MTDDATSRARAGAGENRTRLPRGTRTQRPVATAVIAIAGGFSHLTIWIEVALIGLFAVFWVLQTIELWKPGLRQPTAVQFAESS